jgi:transcription-repair coupling factor (superfamily II helicase)
MMEQAIHELRGEVQRPDFEPELRLGIPAYIPDSFVPDENERLILYRRLARAGSEQEMDELRDEMRDRFGPLPTLVENLASAMNVRRRMKDMMILGAISKGNQLEVKFHPDAPVDTARLTALVDANRNRMRLTPAFQVLVRIEPGTDYEKTFAQIDGILQALAACEKFEPQPARAAGPLAN